jgi:hypothetical protein
MNNRSKTNDNNIFTFKSIEIYYIDLENQEVRNFAIINEHKKLELNQFPRFNTIKNDNGAPVCALSHKAVLEECNPNSSSLLIVCEEDFEFNCDREEMH